MNDKLNQQEKDWLNNYHKDVYDKISPFLEPEEQEWLKEYTKSI
jgi:Xaa-Pro aminopeptidase